MSSDRQAARIKRRAERLGPPSRVSLTNRHSSNVSSDAKSSHLGNFGDFIASSDPVHRQPPRTSPTAVATSSRPHLHVHSPRDINVLVEKLLAKVHRAPSALIARRAVVRLHDAVPTAPQTDAFAVLEKIKRKIVWDAPEIHADAEATVTRLNEVYSRFVRFKNLDKKTEALLLLYGLMNTAAPIYRQETATHRATSTNDPSVPSVFDGFSLDRKQVSHTMPAASLTNVGAPNAAPPRTEQSNTELDSLEDSFKFAIGIGPGPKPSRGISNSPRHQAQRLDSDPIESCSAPAGCTSFDVPEEVLLRDVLYALQAIESRYLYFDDSVDCFQIIKSAGVPTRTNAMRQLIHLLCELGWMFRNISEYIKQHRQELAFGLVGQSFCHVLNTELSAYFRLIAVLAAQIDEDAEKRQPKERGVSSLTLRTLIVWVQDPLDKMRLMARLIDSVEGLRGGALASGIHSHALHGDPDVSQFVQKVLKQIAAPIVRMIKRWVFEGELEDGHGEFFVMADSTVSDDQFWAKKYTLNLKMLPAFISIELAKKILVIGKSINFIRQCCGHADWVMDAAHETSVIGIETDDEGAYFAELKRLETVIENVSNSTNKYLIRTLTEKYRLLDHCLALKRYLLLGQGDFVQYLMDLLGPELSKRGSQVYRHTLTNVLETALNASNAKFEAADILGRLDVELLQGSSGGELIIQAITDVYSCLSPCLHWFAADTGWEIFCLHYNIQAPVNSVIPATSMLQYQQIFVLLWHIKRVEHSLSASWSKDMNLGHEVQGCVPEMRPVLHRSQLIRCEMIHFITNLLNYMMFEVLETAWHKLVKDLNAAKDLDELLESHAAYIASIKKKGFMTKESRDVLKQLKLIFASIIRFSKVQENLYTIAMHEKHVEESRQQGMQRKELDGSWGILEENEHSVRAARDTFGTNSKILRQIEDISGEFSNRFLELLNIVKQNSRRAQSLSFLMSRFDFNEFYQNKTAPPMDADR